jgi:hypothetical protein
MPAKGWRDFYKIHPAANLFPEVEGDELLALGEDIKANEGRPKHPIVLIQKKGSKARPAVFDGRSRLDAMELVGLPTINADGNLIVPYETVEETADFDALAYVISLNWHRRHLKPEQRDEVIRNTKAMRKELSVRALAIHFRVSKSTVDRALQVSQPGTPESEGEAEPDRVVGLDGKTYPGSKPSPPPEPLDDPRVVVLDGEILPPEAPAKPPTKAKPPADKPQPTPAPSPAPSAAPKSRDERDRGTVLNLFAGFLHNDPKTMLDEIERLLRYEQQTLSELPKDQRIAVVRGLMTTFGLVLDDLRPIA